MTTNKKRNIKRETIGLIPAGGQGNRISPIPCSKEIYPIGFDESEEARPKAVCHYLLEKMRFAGIIKAYIILREGKWDIPSYLRDGKMLGMNIAYLIMGAPFGVPYTIDQAFPFVRKATIAFGFPDIFFDQEDVFMKLLNRLKLQDCDVVLGLFPSDSPHKADMVDIDREGKIKRIVIKPKRTNLNLTWGVAVWAPIFTEFMHHYVMKAIKPHTLRHKELFIGEVIQAAINEGLRIEAVHVSNRPYIDIGTPDDLLKAVKYFIAKADKNH